ncbi:MAG: hypothetical protein IIX77_03045, partial [Oscillospiraceae bacterium]|nr:hypothetical protein [Oscillospiraceae bacterium]
YHVQHPMLKHTVREALAFWYNIIKTAAQTHKFAAIHTESDIPTQRSGTAIFTMAKLHMPQRTPAKTDLLFMLLSSLLLTKYYCKWQCLTSSCKNVTKIV